MGKAEDLIDFTETEVMRAKERDPEICKISAKCIDVSTKIEEIWDIFHSMNNLAKLDKDAAEMFNKVVLDEFRHWSTGAWKTFLSSIDNKLEV